jgi:uncharacterized protein YdaU (DUF1376 family)
VNYFQHHIGDYRRDTSHLSLLEHGVYRQLLDWYYLDEKPIPAETQVVYRRLSAKTESDQAAVDAVLADFFRPTKEGWKHKKCEEVIEEYHKNSEKNKENGKKGGRPPKDKNNPQETQSVIVGLPEQTESKGNQEPLTNKPETKEPQTSLPPKPPRGRESDFETFWAAYPRKVGKDAARRCWMKKKNLPPVENVLAAVKKQVRSQEWQRDSGQFIPHPATWINQGRWDDGGMDYQALSGKPQRAASPPAPQGPSVEEQREALAQEWFNKQTFASAPLPHKDWPPELKKQYEDYLAAEMAEAFAKIRRS